MATFPPDQALYTFKPHWAVLGNGSRVHYVDESEGPVRLFLLGNPPWSLVCRNIIRRLRGQYRSIAPDPSGFALFQAADHFRHAAREQAQAIAGFIDHLERKEICVMAQDWGGSIRIFAARPRPERIDRLIKRERSRFQAAFPDNKCLGLIGIDHLLQEDAPDAISEAIAAWCAEGETGPQWLDAAA